MMNSTHNNNIIKVQAYLNSIVFPKPPNILGTENNNWGVTKWRVSLVYDGEVKFKSKNTNEISVVGPYFYGPIVPEKPYKIMAKEAWDEKFGLQYDIISIKEEIDFTQLENQERFLKGFCTDTQIKEMYEIFENPIEIIASHDIEELKKVKGVGEYTARKIIEKFEEYRDNSQAYMELDQYDLSHDFIDKVIQYCNNNIFQAIDVIKKHPYDLIKINGIGFKKADEIALKVGIPSKSPDRIKAFVLHFLKEQGNSGNSYLFSKDLTIEIYNTFGGKENILEVYKDENGNIIDNNISKAIRELVHDNYIIVEDNEERSARKIYLKYYYHLEEQICAHLKRLLNSNNNFEFSNWKEILKKQEKKQGWTFTEEQKQGIELGLHKQVCFITGGAGCGKSSLVAGILSVLGNYEYAQCALSGKAAARLKEVTGQEGFTIHRLLKGDARVFFYNEDNPLPYNIIIVDEISLVGGEIFLSLLKAIPNGTKLILLGDMGQLESIGAMNLASDIYHSNIIPKQELTKIHRQAQKSGIITTSSKIRNGQQIFEANFSGERIVGELEDMILNIDFCKDNTKDTCVKYFNKYYNSDLVNKDIMNIQIVSPVHERGNSSVFSLNLAIQNIVNPDDKIKPQITVRLTPEKSYNLRENDKILCLSNNYGMHTEDGGVVDIFNGWLGKITKIDLTQQKINVYFPLIKQEVVFFDIREFVSKVSLGYAITCHKMQGASAKVIVGVIDYYTPPSMLTKELLYTLITRAEKLCVLVGQNRAVRTAIKNSGISHKKTFLKDMLDGDVVSEQDVDQEVVALSNRKDIDNVI